MKYWLMKSEPSVYSIWDLRREKVGSWDGVRNYQARNYMRDEMKKGDLVLYYHSNAKPSGVAGVAKVCKEAYPDFTAWKKDSKYFDPKSSQENPRWMMVDIEYVEVFSQIISLEELKKNINLQDMLVVKKGMRLSIQPMKEYHFKEILRIAGLDFKKVINLSRKDNV